MSNIISVRSKTSEAQLLKDREEYERKQQKRQLEEQEKLERKNIRDANISKRAMNNKESNFNMSIQSDLESAELIKKIMEQKPYPPLVKQDASTNLFTYLQTNKATQKDARRFPYISRFCKNKPLLGSKGYYKTCHFIEDYIRERHSYLFEDEEDITKRLENDMAIWLLKQRYVDEHVREINAMIRQFNTKNATTHPLY